METYVSECLQCPFEASMRGRGEIEKIRVLKVVSGERREIRCEAEARGAKVMIPLSDIEPLARYGAANRRVVQDYRAQIYGGW